ncbi:MAG: response regulator [Desulfobacterales bacterium]
MNIPTPATGLPQILLVDDEPGIRKVLGITLEDWGYEVRSAEDGRQALELFRQIQPAIVLTDIKMPVMDGVTLLRRIKAEEPDTEVIMISGHGDLDLAIESLKLEATDFITKPINDDALTIALKRAREKIDMRRQLKAYTENLERMVQEKTNLLLEAERRAVVGQAVEGLAAAMSSLAGDMGRGVPFFNELPCLVSIHNHDLQVVAANELYLSRLGAAIGQPSWAVYRGKDGENVLCPAAKTFAQGSGQRCREKILYPDGREQPVIVHTAPVRSGEGRVELVIEISADISEIQKLQEELRYTQRKYQQLFESVPCYISVWDREQRLTAANRLFTDDFAQAPGGRREDICPSRGDDPEQNPVRGTFGDGKPRQSEIVAVDNTGSDRRLLSWSTPLPNRQGEILEVMEMATDITEIRRLQDNLSSIGLMVGEISHSFKGVVTGLDAGTYLIKTGMEKEKPERLDEGLELVRLMADRIRNLVLNVLYYAKERPLNIETIHGDRFVNDILLNVENKAREQGIQLVQDVDPELGHFQADPHVLRIAVVNILHNAMEACRADESGREHRITLYLGGKGDGIDITISDNGVGMDRNALNKIFSLFFSTKGGQGTGLGLFITKKIIDQHGGAISVTSDVGQGSCFHITIPRQSSAS